jgi:outer membrane protein TolC
MNKHLFLFVLSLLLVQFVSAVAQDNAALERWLALPDAIGMARQQSPAVRKALNQYRNRFWQFRFYRSNYLPQLSLQGTLPNFNRSIVPVTQEDGSQQFREVSQSVVNADLTISQNIGPTGGQVYLGSGLQRIDNFAPTANNSYSARPFYIGISQPLFGFNELQWDRKIEPLRYEEARREYQESMEQISFRTTDLYFTALLAQIQLEIAEKNVANNDTLYKVAEGRFNLGRIAENELLQLELALMNARQNLAQSELQLESGLLALRVQLGLTDNVPIRLVVPDRIPQFSVNQDSALALARRNRSQIVGFERQLLEAQSEVAKARGETGLNADLQANFGFTQQAGNLSGLYVRPQDQQLVALGFRIPLVDWGRTRSRTKTAQANQELVEANVQQDRITFEQQVYLQVKQFEVLRRQMEVARKADEVGEKRYEISKNRYQIGKIGITDLTIAQQEKDRAKLDYAQALRDFWLAYYNLRFLTLYDFESNQSLFSEELLKGVE